MLKHKKILVFCPPFNGHLNVLKTLIEHYKTSCQFKIIITGWSNIPLDISSLPTEGVIIGKTELHETDPCLWTFQRMIDLLPDVLEIVKEFKPDSIIYDFFSLEGYAVGKILNIPTICSIPAMVGPFKETSYLANKLSEPSNQISIAKLQELYGLTFDNIEMISDGFHMPGDVNLIWSYQTVTPENFLEGRANKPYVFIGNLSKALPRVVQQKQTIYFSLGTVVMNNLWNQQEKIQVQLKDFINQLAIMWADAPWNVIFVTQGKDVLDMVPKNWSCINNANQILELSRADLFITHGGSNSFHEAIIHNVPMIVIPFFGDQPLVGSVTEKLGIGIHVNKNQGIDTHNSKDFLNKDLARTVDALVRKMLNTTIYREAYTRLTLECYSLSSIIQGKIPFKEGDLLYGTNVARHNYINETDSNLEFGISKFRPFNELAQTSDSLPRIVDIYHDVIKDSEFYTKDMSSPLETYKKYLNDYKIYLEGETDICTMCIKSIDFFSQKHTLHFIVEDFEPSKNYITTKEIKYILDREKTLLNNVIFYKKFAGFWTPITPNEVKILMSDF